MNKTQIFGIIILIFGIVGDFALENDKFGFYYGAAIGLGIGLFFTGRKSANPEK